MSDDQQTAVKRLLLLFDDAAKGATRNIDTTHGKKNRSVANMFLWWCSYFLWLLGTEQCQCQSLPMLSFRRVPSITQKQQQQQQQQQRQEGLVTNTLSSSSGAGEYFNHGHHPDNLGKLLVAVPEDRMTFLPKNHSSKYNYSFPRKLKKAIISKFLVLYKHPLFQTTSSTTTMTIRRKRYVDYNRNCRTRFMLKLPSPDELYKIMAFEGSTVLDGFNDKGCNKQGSTAVNNQRRSYDGLLAQQSHIMAQFNHNDVGITKPYTRHVGDLAHVHDECKECQLDESKNTLYIATGCDDDDSQTAWFDNHDRDNDNDLSKLWWPRSQYEIFGTTRASTMVACHQKDGENGKGNMKWRIKRYRKRVGYGKECYDHVRDAVLEWEFQSNHGDNEFHSNDVSAISSAGGGSFYKSKHSKVGIQRALQYSAPSSNSGTSYELPPEENMNPNVVQICNSLASPTHKKLVTYTQFHLMPFFGTLENISKHILLIGSEKNECSGGLHTKIRKKLFLGFKNMFPTIYVINPVRVIYDIVDEQSPNGDLYTCTAYATLGGHLLRGEERVCVILHESHSRYEGNGNLTPRFNPRHDGKGRTVMLGSNKGDAKDHGYVDVEILSYSKPAANILGLMVWPFIGKKQEDFFQCQLHELEKVAFQSGTKKDALGL
mmetsp:Transcript_14340/g.26916  ORF Transcript_14340/g.26916 Transcript_14340/m.26916 type:complete len:657 (+) Transcript_14340:175-2145(+)